MTGAEGGAPRDAGSALFARRGATRGETTFRWVATAAGCAVLAILGLIAWSTTREAWPALSHEGIGFVTADDWVPNEGRFGALAFVYGTLVSSLIALVLAVPVSLGIAVFTNEAAPRRIRRSVIAVVDLLAAIPSVVYGLWGVLVLAPAVTGAYDGIGGALEGVPFLGAVFGGPGSGRSFMTAGIVLAIMITPIITSLSREVIATVPRAQREAAYGLGATRWETIRHAVLPWSRGGIVSAVMLGLGRALGETIAVALVIGSTPQISSHVFFPGDAMAAVIANQFGEAGALHRSALVGLGVVLFVLTIAVNVAARGIAGRTSRARVVAA